MTKAAGTFVKLFVAMVAVALLCGHAALGQDSTRDVTAPVELEQQKANPLPVAELPQTAEPDAAQDLKPGAPLPAASSHDTDLLYSDGVINPDVLNSVPERKTPTTLPIASPPKINSGANLMNLVLGLALIVGLIFALSWLVKRMGQGGLLTGSQIKVVAAMPLGTRERIVVVEVGGQQLLLGITAAQINTLHVFPEPVIDGKQASVPSEFSKKLMTILQQKALHQPQTKSATEPRQ